MNIFENIPHKHLRKNWINIQCPFCGDKGHHGGINISKTPYYSCFRCGWKPILMVMTKAYALTIPEAKQILKGAYVYNKHASITTKSTNTKCTLPFGTQNITKAHENYLKKRRYNPKELIEKWGIKGTTIFGDYRYRVIIPIYLNGDLVTFQGRDITGKAKAKYKSCSIKEEVVNIKKTLYGIDNIHSTGIIVEGAMDAWRIGYGALATFGTEFTLEQIWLMVERCAHIYICFDGDSAGKIATDKLSGYLTGLGAPFQIIDIDGDPDDLSIEDVKKLRKMTKID